MATSYEEGGVESNEDRGVFPRRAMLQLGGHVLLGVIAASRADSALGEYMWPSTDTYVREFERFSYDDHRQPWLVAPGLGMKSGSYISRQLGSIGINSAYFEIPDQGASIAKMAVASQPLMERARSVNMVGASMGAIAMLEAARLVARAGAARPIKNLVMISSPFEMADARFSQGAEALNLAGKLGYTGGPVGHIGYRLTVDAARGRLGDRSMPDEFSSIWYEITKGNPFSVTTSGITMLAQAHIAAHIHEYGDYGLINEQTRIFYARSMHAATDKVVDVDAAPEKWRNTFAQPLGAKFEEVLIPNMRHADVAAAIPALRKHITN